jgi:ring-1,2-phenylacetyl-CoA epoxidase subunit PaaA
MIEALHSGKAKYSSIFNYPTLTWADVGVIGWLVDGAAIMNQVPICRCSYGPYARAMIRICREESFHQRQGYEILLTMMSKGTDAQKRDGAGRGEPLVVAVDHDVRPAGRPVAQLRAVDALGHQARLQRRTAPEVHRRRRRTGQGAGRHAARPRPEVERGAPAHDFGKIDWDEFWNVVGGHGPCNRERLAARVKAWEEGAWVREAAMAYGSRGFAAREQAGSTRRQQKVAKTFSAA